MAQTSDDKLDIITEQLKLSVDNQNQIKGAVTELREFVGSTNETVRNFLSRLVEVETMTDQLGDRLTKIEGTQLEMQLADKRGKWKIITLIVTCILGWLGVIIQRYIGG